MGIRGRHSTIDVVTDERAGAAAGWLDGYRPRIYGFILKRGFSRDEAEDLTQETLVRAYLHCADFRGGRLSTWLCSIARNAASDYRRRRRVHSVPLEDAPAEAVSWNPQAADPDRYLDLLSLIEALPQPSQELLWLRYLEGKSHVEIAVRLNCTPRAAKQRVFRVVTALRRLAGRASSCGPLSA